MVKVWLVLWPLGYTLLSVSLRLFPFPYVCVLKILSILKRKKKILWVNPTLENECKLKRFKICAMYQRVRLFWIYTTVNFFKTFSPLPVCVLKILIILKTKLWVNHTLENECKLKRFKACTVYPRVRLFWIFTTISLFKTFSILPMCVC